MPSFKIIGLHVLQKKIFKGFCYLKPWQPSWSCGFDLLYKFSFPLPNIAPLKVWLLFIYFFFFLFYFIFFFFGFSFTSLSSFFTHIETNQSVGGAKTGVPGEKPPDTPASRTWLVSHMNSCPMRGANLHR